jgi:hypothetical protein
MREMIAIIACRPVAERAWETTRCASSVAQTDEVKRNLERLQPVGEKYGY